VWICSVWSRQLGSCLVVLVRWRLVGGGGVLVWYVWCCLCICGIGLKWVLGISSLGLCKRWI
jgi:hypothetical protein